MSDLDLEQELRAALHTDVELPVRADLARRALEGNRRRRAHRLSGAVASVVAIVLVIGAVGLTGRIRSNGGGGTYDRPASGVSSPSPHPTGSSEDPGPVSLVGRPAQREVGHLLSLADLPPGSTRRTTHPNTFGSGRVIASATSPYAVAGPVFYLVPVPIGEARSYVLNHRPAGLADYGSGERADGVTVSEIDQSFSSPDTATYQQAALDFSIVPDGPQHTYWRIEASALAVDPTPAAVTDHGTAVRVVVPGSCPTLPASHYVANPDRAGLSAALLPGGAPTAGLVCRYSETGGGPQGTTRLSGSSAVALAQDIQASTLGHAKDPSSSCPGQQGPGTVVIIALTYPGRPDVDVEVTTLGCSVIDNGVVQGAPNISLLDAIYPR